MMWLGMLRVFALDLTCGPLVIIFQRMIMAALPFMLILLILVMTFAILIDGSLPQNENKSEDETWEQCFETEQANGIVFRCNNPICNFRPHLFAEIVISFLTMTC